MFNVSIIIPAYNVEGYINRCLNSVINQTYSNIEIIVVNDGSTDGTLEIIKNYCNLDSRIKLIDITNHGVNYARKIGFSQATAEYIVFLDADDWLELNSIEKLKEVVDCYPNIDLVFYDSYRVDETRKNKINMYSIDNKKCDLIKELFLDHIACTVHSKLIRRSLMGEINEAFPCDVLIGEDLAMVFNWLMKEPNVYYLNMPLYNYYGREGSITTTINEKTLQLQEPLQYIKNELVRLGLFEKYQEYYEYLVYKHLIFYKFALLDDMNPIHYQFYEVVKKQEINYRNPLIHELGREYPKIIKLRLNLYLKNYTYGKRFDNFKRLIKKVLHK